QVADEALLHPGGTRRVGLDELVDAAERIEKKVRLDLGLQRLHTRFEHGALELLGLGPLGGLRRRQLRAALAAGHDLGDDGDDEEQEKRLLELQNPPQDTTP